MIDFIRSIDAQAFFWSIAAVAAMGWLFLFPPNIGGDEP